MASSDQLPVELDIALRGRGLKREVVMGSQTLPFNNVIIEYFNKEIGIQVMCDRGIWGIALKDIVHLPGRWFPLEYLRRIIVQGSDQHQLTFGELERFVEVHWMNCHPSLMTITAITLFEL